MIDPATRRDNLFAQPPGDPGAHGRFDDRAKSHSPQLWLTLHKRALLACAAVAGAAAGALPLRADARREP